MNDNLSEKKISCGNTLQKVYLKGTAIQIEKAPINDRLPVLKVFWKFGIPTFYNSAVIYPWNLLFS